MSNSQLDDLNDQQGNEAIAKALKISVEELEELDYGDIETNKSSDGLVYSYYIEIQKDTSSETILDKVIANTSCDDNGEYITAYLELENYPDDDDKYQDDKPQDDTNPTNPKGKHRLF